MKIRTQQIILSILIFLVFTFIFATMTRSQVKMKPWDWNGWKSTVSMVNIGKPNLQVSDKALHFTRSYVFVESMHTVGIKHDWQIATLFNILYEIKDGIVPYDSKGNIEGFDRWDFIFDELGVGYAKLKQNWSFKTRLMILPIEVGAVMLLIHSSN